MKMLIKTLLFSTLLLIFISCIQDSDNSNDIGSETSDGFLPLHVGNYWKINEENYTVILDTIRINNNKFYHVSTLDGGDAYLIQYLRIDEDHNLISSYPDNPEFKYTMAKFNAELGDSFFTLNDSTVNDYKVTVITKNDTLIEFEYELIYHSMLKGSKHTNSFKKNIGWVDNYSEVQINGNIFTF